MTLAILCSLNIEENNTWHLPLNKRDRKIANNYNTILKTVTQISTYLYIYNCRALIPLRLIRDLLYDLLFSPKTLVCMCYFKSA